MPIEQQLSEQPIVRTTSGPDHWSLADVAARVSKPLEFIHAMVAKRVIESREIDGQVVIPRHAALSCGSNNAFLIEYKNWKKAQGPAPAPEPLDDRRWVLPETAAELVYHPHKRGSTIDVGLVYAEMESGAIKSRFDESRGQRLIDLKDFKSQLRSGLNDRLRKAQEKLDDEQTESRYTTKTKAEKEAADSRDAIRGEQLRFKREYERFGGRKLPRNYYGERSLLTDADFA